MKDNIRGALAGPCASYAFMFLFLESLKAHRSSFWTGASLEQALGLGVGSLMYLAALLMLTGALLLVLERFKRFRKSIPSMTTLVPAFAAVVIWTFLSRYRPEAPTMDDALVLVLIGGVAATGVVLQFLKRPAAWLVLLCGGAFLAGTACAPAAANLFFLSPERADLATYVSIAAMASAGFGLTMLMLLKRPKSAALALVVMVAMPPVANLFLAHSGAPRASMDKQPNLVLITCDALRADMCGVYGGPAPTPNLERAARDGVLFTQAHSLAPWTLPSMVGMFESAYAKGLTPGAPIEQWREEMGQYRVADGQPMLAELLQERGYATGGFVGNPLLRHRDGFLRGFDATTSYEHLAPEPGGLFGQMPFLRDALAAWCPALVPASPLDTSRILTRFAEKFLGTHQDVPFFLWVHFMDPHDPYDPPDRYRTREGPWRIWSPASPRWGSPQYDTQRHMPGITADERDYVQSLYLGEISYVDECIGRVIDRLSELGLDESTYVCVTADHGEGLWEHERVGHGATLYENEIHVPVLLLGPDIAARRVDQPVSTLDLTPTLAALVEVPELEAWRGTSWARFLREGGDAPVSPAIYANATHHPSWPDPQEAVIEDKLKYMRRTDSGRQELFDLDADRQERHDMAADDPAAVESFEVKLDAWQGSYDSGFEAKALSDDEQRRMEEQIDKLRAIGYVE